MTQVSTDASAIINIYFELDDGSFSVRLTRTWVGQTRIAHQPKGVGAMRGAFAVVIGAWL